MNQSSLEKQLQQPAPAPDPAARLAARRAAVKEFKRLHGAVAQEPATERRGGFQGLLGRLRLSRHRQDGSDSMAWYSRKMWVGGMASMCVALLGGTIVWSTLRQHPELTELSQQRAPARQVGSETTVPTASVEVPPAPDVPPPEVVLPAESAPIDSAPAASRSADEERGRRDAARLHGEVRGA